MQPVAAGPAKVGENWPKLDVVTSVVGALVVFGAGAAAVLLETSKKRPPTISIKIAIENPIDLFLALILANMDPPPGRT